MTSFKVAEPKFLYTTVYCGRGEGELFIKECKLGLGSDTSPCQKATADQFRLLLHAAAYAIMHRFRSTVLKRDEVGAQDICRDPTPALQGGRAAPSDENEGAAASSDGAGSHAPGDLGTLRPPGPTVSSIAIGGAPR